MPTTADRFALPARTGVGLKHAHADALLAAPCVVGFVEVHAENVMVDGGPRLRLLDRARAAWPLSLHGVGLSIGGEAPLDAAHLDRLRALVRRWQPATFSEHLAWSSHGGAFFNDLLPLPYNAATLARVCDHVDQVQQHLGCRMLLENPATYVEFDASSFDEASFITQVLRRTGCGLLLDVNNLWVSSMNHGRDPFAALAALPDWVLRAVGEIHIAGHAVAQDSLGAPLLIDTHGAPVADGVWALLDAALARSGLVPVLIERDNDLPPLAHLLAEVARGDAALVRAAAQLPPHARRPVALTEPA
jgi:hypothetical protein